VRVISLAQALLPKDELGTKPIKNLAPKVSILSAPRR